ncbi:hypothetical protein CRUP_030756 [Coryphaenoides rupestris]|nr:hypothetical protein CRUP_030756 [Coryphaenoides rupestris]
MLDTKTSQGPRLSLRGPDRHVAAVHRVWAFWVVGSPLAGVFLQGEPMLGVQRAEPQPLLPDTGTPGPGTGALVEPAAAATPPAVETLNPGLRSLCRWVARFLLQPPLTGCRRRTFHLSATPRRSSRTQHQASPGTGSAVSPSASLSCGKTHHSVALASLDPIIHRRRLGADHYASDPQLALKTMSLEEIQERARPPAECRRMVTSRSSILLGSCSSSSSSRESLEAPGLVARRALPGFERRGSGAFLLDHLVSGQYHPRCCRHCS